MHRKALISLLAVAGMAAILSGCSDTVVPSENLFIQTEEGSTIKMVSRVRLSKAGENSNHFVVRATFTKLGGAIILSANATEALEKGVTVQCAAVAGNNLRCTALGSSGGFGAANDFTITGVELNKPVTLSVDVHNAEGGAPSAHVLVWLGEGNYPVASPPVPPLFYNKGVSGAGQDKYWGVRYSKDGVTLPSNPSVLLDAPKYEH